MSGSRESPSVVYTIFENGLVAENDDFVSIAPFASRSPFELGVFPKNHSSAFSRMSSGQIENLARLVRDVLQKLDKTLGGPAVQSCASGPAVLASPGGLLKDHRRRFPLAPGDLAPSDWGNRIRAYLVVLLQPCSSGTCGPMPLRLTRSKLEVTGPA